MKLNEIFMTEQGEGLWSGALTTFIRFAGCHLRCQDCDTSYSWEQDGLTDVGVPYILDEVLKVNARPRHICITGGEPLEQPKEELFNLLQALYEWYGSRGLESIVIETNGAQDVGWLLNKPFRKIVHLSVDYKLPCTGRSNKMVISNFMHLEARDVVKFICKDEGDFAYAQTILDKMSVSDTQPVVLFHSLGGKPVDWLAQAALSMGEKYHNRFDVRIGCQLHKIFGVK